MSDVVRISGHVVLGPLMHGLLLRQLEIDRRKVAVERMFGRVDVFLREASRLVWWRTSIPFGIVILLGPCDGAPTLAFRPTWGKELLSAATAAGWDPQRDRTAYAAWRDQI